MREHHNDGGISIAVATGIHTVRCRHRNRHMLGVSQIHHVPQCPLFEHQTLTVAAAKHNCCFVSYAAFSIRLESNPRPLSALISFSRRVSSANSLQSSIGHSGVLLSMLQLSNIVALVSCCLQRRGGKGMSTGLSTLAQPIDTVDEDGGSRPRISTRFPLCCLCP